MSQLRCQVIFSEVVVRVSRLTRFCSVFGQSGAGNNWAKGHYTEGESGHFVDPFLGS